ncbi:MAG TPA: hypothetical protein VL132_01100 [Planctomycetaceae bacterium]|nr:hypothetical protein [Planctomycetaceae bacterium]
MPLSNLMFVARALNAAHRVVYSVLRWVGLLFGLIPRTGRLSPTVYRIIHYAFIIGATLLLAYYSTRFIPESRVPISHWFVQRYYIAIQFVLFYLFVRLLIAGVLLFLARDVSEFEDIDRAWEAGVEALAREGFDLQWLPVFLVSGATPEQSKSLFEGSRLTWKVNTAGDDPQAALTFHACDEALFICLNDVGAMSRQLRKTAASRPGVSPAAVHANPAVQSTLRPGQIQAAVEQTRRPDQIQSAMGQTLPPGAIKGAVAQAGHAPLTGGSSETLRPGAIAGIVGAASTAPAPARPVLLEKLSQQELLDNRRRLDYFCERLVAERGAYCPVNGLLQVIPLRWTQSTAYEPLFASIGQDLQTLHDGLHLQFPVVCLHAGLEEVIGSAQFLDRGRQMDARFLDSRAGSRYPAGLPIDDKSTLWVVERGLLWFRDWVYAEFAKNLASPQNRQLYQFLCALSDRRERLARELRSAMGEMHLRLPVRLSGCYFAATGADASRQAFVHGVMQRLMGEQNDVAWLPEWRARDQRRLWLTGVFALLTLGVLAADGLLAWRIWEHASQLAAR